MLESREIDAVTEVGSKAVITETDEKPEHDRIENLTAVDSVAELNHGASALEKRVLRKLDWRVIPLVNTLCKFHMHTRSRSQLTIICNIQIFSPTLIALILGPYFPSIII
jgi:hypothetical protein